LLFCHDKSIAAKFVNLAAILNR